MAYIKCKGVGIPKLFGDGSLGDAVISESETWSAETEDTGVIEKQFKSLVVEAEAIIEASNRNSGMIIRVQGDCTINGSIINKKSALSHTEEDAVAEYYPEWFVENIVGGRGANGEGNNSAGQAVRFYGGGVGGGGKGGNTTGGVGASGGNGGDATNVKVGNTNNFKGGTASSSLMEAAKSGNAGANAGGGSGACFAAWVGDIQSHGYGGGGGNNPSGNGGNGYGDGRNGQGSGGGGAGGLGGGVIIIYCGGKLTVNGSIICSGNNGGLGGTGSGRSAGYSSGYRGGSGGGGRIYLLYKRTFINNGTYDVTKGTGGNNGTDGDKYYINYNDFNDGMGVPTPLDTEVA